MEEVKDSSPEKNKVGYINSKNETESSQNNEYISDLDIKSNSLTSTCSSKKVSFDLSVSETNKESESDVSVSSEFFEKNRVAQGSFENESLISYENADKNIFSLSKENNKTEQENEINLDENTPKDLINNNKFSKNQFLFEEKFRKYYVEADKNTSVNFDNYLSKALSLINYFPNKNDKIFLEQINKNKIFISDFKEEIKYDPNKKTLILDMDETLIHTDVDFQYQFHDELLNVDIGDEKNILLPLIKRPFLDKFLSFAKQNFNLILFTASQKEYAEPIINYIEKKNKFFCAKFYRNSCLTLNPGIIIKDLRIFSEINLENILIIENNLFAFANQLNNGILLSSFFYDKNDQMLLNLIYYLDKLKEKNINILQNNKDTFKFEEYLEQIRNNLNDL